LIKEMQSLGLDVKVGGRTQVFGDNALDAAPSAG
jgi:hypothetical protein